MTKGLTDETLTQAERVAMADRAMAVLCDICQFDRLQASPGINAAADCLAGHVSAFDPVVKRYDVFAGGAWWDVGMPHGHAPVDARIEVGGFCLDMSFAPMMVAAGSCATPPGDGRITVRRYDPRACPAAENTLWLVSGDRYAGAMVRQAGLRVFATDAPACRGPAGQELRGRLELDAADGLTGFSLTSGEFRELTKNNGAAGVAVLRTRRSPMLVVSWTLPGAVPGEIWIMAHLCHRTPGAHDNASGLAGLVTATEHLQTRHRADKDKTIRFIAGPEFTGVSAVLWERCAFGQGKGPDAVINLDMIGLDPEVGDSCFCIERTPGGPAHAIDALAEYTISAEFAEMQIQYDTMPFHGYSDNALFSAGAFAAPTVQFCHPSDVCNHTDGDTPARISPVKTALVGRAAGDLALLLGRAGTVVADRTLVALWCTRERKRLTSIAAAQPERWASGFLDASMARLDRLKLGVARPRAARNAALQPGPMNLRGYLARCCPRTQAQYAEALRLEKRTLSAVLLALVRRLEGCDRDTAVQQASFDLETPFDPETIALLHAVLSETLPDKDTDRASLA